MFSFGDARFFGSTGAIRLNSPIVGMAPTPTGKGYWMVASDGGVFTFGDARFKGSLASLHPPSPTVAIVPTRTGHGYWLELADREVIGFGDAARARDLSRESSRGGDESEKRGAPGSSGTAPLER